MQPKRSASQSGLATLRSLAGCLLLLSLVLSGCKAKEKSDPAKEAPPASPQVVESGTSSDSVHIERAERFPLVAAVAKQLTSQLNVTGSVSPDVSREIPVLSLANGRVTALHVQLGQAVHKGQLVMEVQSPDVTSAFDSYLKQVNDEHLTAVVLERDKLLYDKGAIAKSQLEIAENGEADAKADLLAAEQQLRILGVDKNHPGDSVKVYAPASGVVISQNVTAAGAAGITYAGAQGSLTIADLSHVWVICDVYENDLATVHTGQHADIRINAFPGKVFPGTISDIGAALDPGLRTAKVRIQVQNPGAMLRIGMFATATLLASHATTATAIPAAAILHLHDRAYVFEPTVNAGGFKRVEVKTGNVLEGNMVEVVGGLQPGQQVVANALDLQNTADQQ